MKENTNKRIEKRKKTQTGLTAPKNKTQQQQNCKKQNKNKTKAKKNKQKIVLQKAEDAAFQETQLKTHSVGD